MRDLLGRNALITGASQGLGAAIAGAFVDAGASVFLCARSGDELARTQSRLAARAAPGQKVLAKTLDVGLPGDLDELVARALDEFTDVHVMVNNAGVLGPFGPLETVDWDEWIAAFRTNLFGTAYGCRAIVPHLKSRGYGKIINLSGGGATSPMPGISAYAASKAAVVRFTETLALELRDHGIDVNAVAPGALATRMNEQIIAAGADAVGADFHQRMLEVRRGGGTPLEQAARLCVYLASPAGDGITGRLISAAWDPWQRLHQRRRQLQDSDVYTLRRIVPSDRGMSWEDP